MRRLSALYFIWILSFSLCNSALAQGSCANILSKVGLISDSSIRVLESSKTLKNKISEIADSNPDIAKYIGDSVSFEQALGYIASKVPDNQREYFLNEVSEHLSKIKVDESESRGPPKIRLRYKSRFLNIKVERYKTATILWSLKTISSEEEFQTLIEKTVDLIAETAFLPIRRASVLLRSRGEFTAENIEAIKDKVLLQLFTLSPDTQLEKTSKPRVLFQSVKNILFAFLPLHFGEIRRAKLTKEYLEVYQQEGPQELYNTLKRRYGLGLSIKYWFTHLMNAKVVLLAIYASFMAPQVFNTYNFIVSEQSVQIDNPEDYTMGVNLLKSMRMPPQDLISEIESHLNELPLEDAAYFHKFLEEVRDAFPLMITD